MPVASMTGFARVEGEAEGSSFVWEIRSVNGKGLDVRFRLPQGFEGAEADLRKLAAARFSRGNVQVGLSIPRVADAPAFSVNEAMLGQILALSDRLIASGHAVTPTADGILALKGIIEVAPDAPASTEAESARRAALLRTFPAVLDALADSRRTEGEALKRILSDRLAEMSDLVDRAERDVSRHPDTIRSRLTAQVAELIAASNLLDEARLHQEVALLAARADIREELDRLATHVGAARAMLDEGGPIGRRLEFLSQEFHRESNTVCSKSNAASLTAIGIELKVVVDQFREQVQNIE